MSREAWINGWRVKWARDESQGVVILRPERWSMPVVVKPAKPRVS